MVDNHNHYKPDAGVGVGSRLRGSSGHDNCDSKSACRSHSYFITPYPPSPNWAFTGIHFCPDSGGGSYSPRYQ